MNCCLYWIRNIVSSHLKTEIYGCNVTLWTENWQNLSRNSMLKWLLKNSLKIFFITSKVLNDNYVKISIYQFMKNFMCNVTLWAENWKDLSQNSMLKWMLKNSPKILFTTFKVLNNNYIIRFIKSQFLNLWKILCLMQ